MPFDSPLVERISEPSDRTRCQATPMPPENFDSRAMSLYLSYTPSRESDGESSRKQLESCSCKVPALNSVVEACNGLQRHSHGIHIRDSVAAARDGPHDLVDVDWFMRARALLDAHGDTRRVRRSQHEFGLARVEERRAAGCR